MAPLLINIKLCASFHYLMWWNYSPETAKLGLDFCDLDLCIWPWLFAWTSSLSMVITLKNFRMIRWHKRCQNGVTDGRTDGQTEINFLRAAWQQLKTRAMFEHVYLYTDIGILAHITSGVRKYQHIDVWTWVRQFHGPWCYANWAVEQTELK